MYIVRCAQGRITWLFPFRTEKEERILSCRLLKRPSSKAAGESKPEAYPQGYVEDFDEPRTKLADFFSIPLEHPFDGTTGCGI